MYFKTITQWSDGPKKAVEHSLRKWKKILHFCQKQEFPNNIEQDDFYWDTCACCAQWGAKKQIGCPLSADKRRLCNGNCSISWLNFVEELRFPDDIDDYGPYATYQWKIMEQSAKRIVKTLERWLEKNYSKS